MNTENSHGDSSGTLSQQDPFRKTCLVPYVDFDLAPPAVQEKLRILPFRRNIFYLLGHSHGLFPHLAGVIGGCFDGNTRKIPLLDWQLIVLRTATTLGAKYEYDVNLPVAEVYEMPQEKIAAITSCTSQQVRDGKGPWTERERLILRIVDEQLETYTNEPKTVRDALQVLTKEDFVEVLIILGTYALIARVINGLKIDDDPPIPGLKDMLRKAVTSK
jgi:alkylhydroperoxidase family enzyme